MQKTRFQGTLESISPIFCGTSNPHVDRDAQPPTNTNLTQNRELERTELPIPPSVDPESIFRVRILCRLLFFSRTGENQYKALRSNLPPSPTGPAHHVENQEQPFREGVDRPAPSAPISQHYQDSVYFRWRIATNIMTGKPT